MKTLHVLILAGAILGVAWMLKPAPVEQLSQVELQRREELIRWILLWISYQWFSDNPNQPC
jgi:hypothetical protein